MITRQVEHPHTMAIALAGALRTISSNRYAEKSSRGNLEVTLEAVPVPSMSVELGSTPLVRDVRRGLSYGDGPGGSVHGRCQLSQPLSMG
jgi:hypothetical protein